MSTVEVVVAKPAERIVFENLMQLYTHDFSEQWYDRPIGEVDEQGRFPPYALDPYWRQPDHIPLLLRANSRIVGFALLNRVTHTDRPLDRNMAEFFVLRKHRRSGAGTAAAPNAGTTSRTGKTRAQPPSHAVKSRANSARPASIS